MFNQSDVIKECLTGTPSAKPACLTVKLSASGTRVRSKLRPKVYISIYTQLEMLGGCGESGSSHLSMHS